MADTFLYFAYGSNMFTRRLAARTPSAVAVATGFVPGRRLTFAKVSTDGSGKCDIEEVENLDERVYGVLFRIASTEAEKLDDAEGVGHGYRKGELKVVGREGTVTAIAYFATERDRTLLPYEWYKTFVVEGAIEHHLPDSYIDVLRAVPAHQDSDENRKARNESLLRGPA